MKKLFTFLCLFLAISSVYAQFVPDANVKYNIVQTPSNLVVGASNTGFPAVVTLANLKSQAFTFVAVSGKPNTYYLLNAAGNYLNKMSSALTWQEGDAWDTSYSTTAGILSEWVISGTDATAIRLMCNFSGLYLASDAGPTLLYCDKTVDNANGLFALTVATIDVTPKFSLLEPSLVLQVENKQPYPIYFTATDQTYDINATASAGFALNKATFTPTEIANGGGKAEVDVNATTAAIGDAGTVIFSYTLSGVTHNIGTANIVLVNDYERFFIMNKDSAGLVIASDANYDPYPVLATQVEEDATQNFIFRPVNPGVTDSLYYIIQDGTYQMLRKDAASNYNTEYGFSSDEAKWKIKLLPDGSNEIINFVNNTYCLATDGLAVDQRLYDNKTFAAAVNAATGPHCEWTFKSLTTGLAHNAVNQPLYVYVANQNVNIHGTLAGDNVKVYNVSGQLVKQLTANSDLTSINLKSGVYVIKVNATVLKVVK
jgi:hypothetical protein